MANFNSIESPLSKLTINAFSGSEGFTSLCVHLNEQQKKFVQGKFDQLSEQEIEKVSYLINCATYNDVSIIEENFDYCALLALKTNQISLTQFCTAMLIAGSIRKGEVGIDDVNKIPLFESSIT